MPDIYDEALVDRKRLLEVAENNAKNKIVDAITPRIKELVESALIGKLDDEIGDDDMLLDIDLPGIPADGIDQAIVPPVSSPGVPATELPVATTDVAAGENAGMSLPDAEGKVTLDVDSFVASADGHDEHSQFELTPESLRVLGALVGTPVVDLEEVKSRIATVEERLKSISEGAESVASNEIARQIKLECERLYANIQASRDVIDEALAVSVEMKLEDVYKRVMGSYSAAGHLVQIVKEMMDLNRSAGAMKKRLVETVGHDDVKGMAEMMLSVMKLHTATKKLYESLGGDDSVDQATVEQVGNNLQTLYTEMRNMVTKKEKQITEADELEAGAEVAGGEDVAGVDADEYLVQLKLPASLDSLVGGENVEVVNVEPAADGDDGADDFSGLDSMGDESMDAPAEDDMEMESDGMYEAKLNDDDIIEIDEAALVAEMKKMKKLREKKSAGKNVNTGGHGAAHFDNFGGGKAEGEKFVDGEDLNAHDPVGGTFLEEGDDMDLDESDDMDASLEETDSGDELEEQRASTKTPTRKNAKANDKQLAETVKKVRAELAEQKLFNTKLVALNRVLQFPGLKQAQKQSIVETLDKGRTVAEVKELYTKIVASLKKGAKQQVKESAQGAPRGSASRTITSASPSNAGDSHPLIEKWQKIAFGGSGLIQG